LGPGLIGFAATQINLLINTILATSVVGAVSWLNYSFRLFQLPVGILGVSIGNSNLVHFSDAWKSGDKQRATDLLQSSYFLSFLFVMPAMAILTAIPEEIVNLIYQRGKFDSFATAQTALGLFCYGLGLIPYALYKIWVPTFYVLDQQKIPVYASLISIASNILFCVLLTPHFGFVILALGTSLSMLINAGIQTFVLKKSLNLKLSFFINKRILKIVAASVLVFIVLERSRLFVSFSDLSFWSKCFVLALKGFIAVFIYASFLYILGEKEAVEKIRAKIFAKLNKKIN
jgi:putative peptidoglycan lipid II flippase